MKCIAVQCIIVQLHAASLNVTTCWLLSLTTVPADESGHQPRIQAQGRLFQTSETPVVISKAADALNMFGHHVTVTFVSVYIAKPAALLVAAHTNTRSRKRQAVLPLLQNYQLLLVVDSKHLKRIQASHPVPDAQSQLVKLMISQLDLRRSSASRARFCIHVPRNSAAARPAVVRLVSSAEMKLT